MSDIPFERYDAEFLSLTDQVQTSIRCLGNACSQRSSSPPKSPDTQLKYCSGLLSQCDELLKQMQIEARSVDDATAKRDLLQKVRTCKANLANLRDDYNAAKIMVERESLSLSNGDGDSASSPDIENGKGSPSASHRERLLQTSNQISRQNETLNNARRVMAETEEVAMEITSELDRNREKIASSHSRVRDVSGLTNQARRIVQSMSRREVQQKLMMYMVGAMLVLAIIVILYIMRR